jgi:hypothetical protein
MKLWDSKLYGIAANNNLEWRTNLNYDISAYENQWIHVAFSISGLSGTQTGKLYVNGILVDTYTGTAGYYYAYPFYIGNGKSSVSEGEFKGLIDDVCVYNYVRTQAQVAWDYNRGKPVGHWRFNEGSGTNVYDESDHSHDGNFTSGNVTWTTAGRFGAALQFDGVISHYVSCAYKSSMNTQNVTLEGWVYRVTPDITGTDHRVMRKSNNYQLGVSPTDGTVVMFVCDDSSAWHSQRTDAGDNIPLNEWHHIAGTYDGDKFRLYIDGILRKTSVSDAFTIKEDTSNIAIGGWGGTNGVWQGKLDDIRLYNYVRTDEQIMQDCNAGAAVRMGD